MSLLKNELITLGTAVMFLTRLPTGRWNSGEPTVLSSATRYFPLVGLVIGLLLSMLYVLLNPVMPPAVVLVLMLITAVLITGALHEDGLADVADSAGAFGVARKLEVMRDSRIGTYGALALILLVALKFSVLWSLSLHATSLVAVTLISAHVLARWSSCWLMYRLPYARADAANRVVADGMNCERLLFATGVSIVCLLPVVLLTGPRVLLLLPLAWLVASLCGLAFRRWYGGITGDCLGAANQVVEVSVMLVVVMVSA